MFTNALDLDHQLGFVDGQFEVRQEILGVSVTFLEDILDVFDSLFHDLVEALEVRVNGFSFSHEGPVGALDSFDDFLSAVLDDLDFFQDCVVGSDAPLLEFLPDAAPFLEYVVQFYLEFVPSLLESAQFCFVEGSDGSFSCRL